MEDKQFKSKRYKNEEGNTVIVAENGVKTEILCFPPDAFPQPKSSEKLSPEKNSE